MHAADWFALIRFETRLPVTSEVSMPCEVLQPVLVAILHFKLFLLTELDFGWLNNIVINGYLWVDFFFILSGFVLTHVYRDSFTDGIEGKALPRLCGLLGWMGFYLHVATLTLLATLELGKLVVDGERRAGPHGAAAVQRAEHR